MLTHSFGEVEAISFDFDGTIADTVGTHNIARLNAFVQMAKHTDDSRFAEVSQAIHDEAHAHGSNPHAIIGWALKEAGIVGDITDERVSQTVSLKKQAYNKLCRAGLNEFPGMTSIVKKSSMRLDSRVGITTTAHRDTEVMPFLRRYGLIKQFETQPLVTYEDVGQEHLKPDPLAYKVMLGRLGLSHMPHRLLAVEDTPQGIESARLAGVRVVAIATTHSATELAWLSGIEEPDYVASSVSRLSAMLGFADATR